VEIWYMKATELQALGLLTKLDIPMLAAYCQQLDVMAEAWEELQKNGRVITNRKGALMRSPWVPIYNDALTHANRLASQFGFTPAARGRIAADPKPKKEANPWDDI
jgi:P27 family predicted phage terminase small subunit